MLDIAYFDAAEEDFPGLLKEPVGWPLADLLRSSMTVAGLAVTAPTPYWDGVAFHVTAGKQRYRLELTPYFETNPPEWSIQIVAANLRARILPSRGLRSIGLAADTALQGDPRISHIRWHQLAQGTTGSGEPRHPG